MSGHLTHIGAASRPAHPFSAEDHELAGRTIVEAMKATKTVRARNAAGKIVYVQEPDWSIRLPAAIKIAEFVGGKPIAMSITANLTPSGAGGAAKTGDDLLALLLAAPEAAADIVEKLKKAAEKTKTVIPVEAVTTPGPSEVKSNHSTDRPHGQDSQQGTTTP